MNNTKQIIIGSGSSGVGSTVRLINLVSLSPSILQLFVNMVKADEGKVNDPVVTRLVLDFLEYQKVGFSYAAFLRYYKIVSDDSGQIGSVQITNNVINQLVN